MGICTHRARTFIRVHKFHVVSAIPKYVGLYIVLSTNTMGANPQKNYVESLPNLYTTVSKVKKPKKSRFCHANSNALFFQKFSKLYMVGTAKSSTFQIYIIYSKKNILMRQKSLGIPTPKTDFRNHFDSY